MRSFAGSASGLVLVTILALTSTACSAGSGDLQGQPPSPVARVSDAPSSAESAASGTSGIAFAPYVSATEAADTEATGGPDAYNLAFAIAKSANSCTPVWGSSTAITDTAVVARVKALKAAGSQIRISFGGASGTELAGACDSVAALADAYAEVLDATGATLADFDIEGDALADTASVTRRAQAVAKLQKSRELRVSYTLPVLPEGLQDDSLKLIEVSNNHDVQMDTVNLMAMNYGTSYTDDMSDYAEQAVAAAHTQLMKALGLSSDAAWHGLAVTAMIGVNNVAGETFTLDDAAGLRDFAETKGLAWLSMWAAFRDQECSGGATTKVSESCSGVEQDAGAFATALGG
jgi:chitinase